MKEALIIGVVVAGIGVGYYFYDKEQKKKKAEEEAKKITEEAKRTAAAAKPKIVLPAATLQTIADANDYVDTYRPLSPEAKKYQEDMDFIANPDNFKAGGGMTSAQLAANLKRRREILGQEENQDIKEEVRINTELKNNAFLNENSALSQEVKKAKYDFSATIFTNPTLKAILLVDAYGLKAGQEVIGYWDLGKFRVEVGAEPQNKVVYLEATQIKVIPNSNIDSSLQGYTYSRNRHRRR